MWTAIGGLIGIISFLLIRYFNKKDNPIEQKKVHEQEINKAITEHDEDAANILLDGSLKRLQDKTNSNK